MGVPKFFRYISERYPCLSEVVREYQLPEFDNLYLDMNGIIHICSHPNDADPHFRITEEKIFKDIFHYIETLFRMIQPQKLFFMAVDGVAPRAKMNQQRGRRFRSAKESEVAEARAREKGEILPTEERFDSNCITPGTEFMTRLHAQLKYFVTLKVSSDKLWQKTKVILSGHEVPGEGEHKIMDYIRYMKSQPDYDPNTRHCLYGLDADLIMLGLCSHEPHFSLLREEVKYGKKNNQKRIPTPEETTFFLLHLSLMREYLDLEFQQLKKTLPFPYDLEHIIDDWVLMGFLVGNDFIPHLPDLHINKGALPILYKTYIDVLPSLGGYINEGGSLRLDRFQKYMEKLASFDLEQFKETSADLKYIEGKTGRKYGRHNELEEEQEDEQPQPPKNKDLAALIASTAELLEGSEDDEYMDTDDEDEDGTSFAEFCAHKKNYYMEKMEYEKVTPEVMRSQAEGYVRAIQWNLNYYYNGCCSWSWFYPHHYAPYISDIRNFSELKLEYDHGQPFLPFQQLLAVLPAASKKLLPAAYHDLMVDDNSPIIQFYPTEFRTDLNGKKQDWEAVVLIPFIEQESLLNAMITKEEQLTDEERSRNKHGPMQIYTYSPERLGGYVSPAYFPALVNNHAKEENVYREQLFVEESRLVKGLCPEYKADVYFLGFPTLKHIPFTAGLERAKVKVFESPSQGDNMILSITPQGHPNVSDVASQLLGKSIYVNWPHMFEARVVAVSSEGLRFTLNAENSILREEISGKLASQWNMTKQGIQEKYKDRLGINIGPTEILVYACTLEDRKCVMSDDGKIHFEKQFNKLPVAYALQTTRTNIAVSEPAVPANMTLEKMYPVGTTLFTLDSHHYGFMASVVEVNNQRVRVKTRAEPRVSLLAIRLSQDAVLRFMSSMDIGRRLGLSSQVVSRITGTIYILAADTPDTERKPFKLNVGLNLKFNRRNEEVYGYTRKDRNGYWYYSAKAEEEIREYLDKFPEVFAYIGKTPGFDDIPGTDLYPDNTEEKLAELGTWLKERGSCSAERQTCGAEVLDEAKVTAIEQYIDGLEPDDCEPPITYNIKPSQLYAPKPKLGQAPDPRASHRLFDRIVNVRESHTVPLGARGTIIGIHDADKGPQAMYDIVFDSPFAGGLKLRCSPHRGYRLPAQAFINRSYGTASEKARSVELGKPTAIVQPNGTEEEAGHSSAFASWRNKPNHDSEGSPGRNIVKQRARGGGMEAASQHRSPRHQYNLQQRSVAADLNLRPEQPRASSKQPHPQLQPPILQSAPAPNQLSNEYLAMLKQLQKAGNNANYAKPVLSVQESSAVLKKVLRIADEDKPVGAPAIQPPHQHQQPTKPALYTKPSAQPNTTPPSSVMHLLSLHQSKGMRLPKYHYLDSQDGTITCTVVCGNGKEFKGLPSYTNEQAAENAAIIAMQCLTMEDQRGLLMRPEQRSHGAGMLPMEQRNHGQFRGMTVGQQDPRSHGQGGMYMRPEQRSYGHSNMMMPGPSLQGPMRHPPTSFPPNSRLSMEWAREPPSTLPQPPVNWFQNRNYQPDWQSKGNAPNHPPPSQRFQQQGHAPEPPPSQRFQQHGHAPETRPPFIPLQAIARARQQPHSAPAPQHAPAQQSQPRQNTQARPATKKDKSGGKGSKQTSTASGRNSTRPARSRLAANFSKPLKFDSEHSQDTP